MNIVPQFLRRKIEHRPALLKIVDNIGWLFFDKVLRMGVGLLVGVWVARHLGPTQFGLYSFATAFVGMFGAVAGLGLQSIVVRDLVQNPQEKEETLGTAAALQVLGGLLAYGLLIGAIFWLRPDDALAKVLVAILGSILLLKSSEIALNWFESQVLSKYTIWVQNSCFLVFSIIKVILIIKNSQLVTFALVSAIESVFVALILLATLKLKSQKLARLRASKSRAITLIKDSWPLMMSAISITIYTKIDQIMIGQIAGDRAAGLYSAATRISEISYLIPGTIISTLLPLLITTKKLSNELYEKKIQAILDYGAATSISASLCIWLASDTIIKHTFGPEYQQAGLALKIHIWALVFVFIGGLSGRLLALENMQLIQLERTVFGATVNVLLNLKLIPDHGIEGAACATIISFAISSVFYDIIRKKTRYIFATKIKALIRAPITTLSLLGVIYKYIVAKKAIPT